MHRWTACIRPHAKPALHPANTRQVLPRLQGAAPTPGGMRACGCGGLAVVMPDPLGALPCRAAVITGWCSDGFAPGTMYSCGRPPVPHPSRHTHLCPTCSQHTMADVCLHAVQSAAHAGEHTPAESPAAAAILWTTMHIGRWLHKASGIVQTASAMHNATLSAMTTVTAHKLEVTSSWGCLHEGIQAGCNMHMLSGHTPTAGAAGAAASCGAGAAPLTRQTLKTWSTQPR